MKFLELSTFICLISCFAFAIGYEDVFQGKDVINIIEEESYSGTTEPENITSTSTSTVSTTPYPTPEAGGRCNNEKVGIKLNDLQRSEFEGSNGNNRGELARAMSKAVSQFCNSNKPNCPNGSNKIEAKNVKFSVTGERSKDLYVDVCITVEKPAFSFGNDDSLFKKSDLESVLKEKTVEEEIKKDFKPFAGVETLPKKKGLRGWQIALIAVGGVAFVAIIAGAIVFAKKKSQNSINSNP